MITRVFTKTVLPSKLHIELEAAIPEIFVGVEYFTQNTQVIVNLSQEPTGLEDQTIVDILNAHVPSYIGHKIEQHINVSFKHLPIYKIDFTLHLMKNVVLSKSVYKALNGRPEKAEYILDGVNMARIEWEFTDAPGGLYAVKELYLSYYQNDGNIGERYLIEKEVIDFNIPNQLEKSIKERVIARDSIVGEIKAVCSGALQLATGDTLENIITLIKPFWNAYKEERDNFIELATDDWMNAIATLDLALYPWMSTPVDAQGTTCQQYMLYRLGY